MAAAVHFSRPEIFLLIMMIGFGIYTPIHEAMHAIAALSLGYNPTIHITSFDKGVTSYYEFPGNPYNLIVPAAPYIGFILLNILALIIRNYQFMSIVWPGLVANSYPFLWSKPPQVYEDFRQVIVDNRYGITVINSIYLLSIILLIFETLLLVNKCKNQKALDMH